MTFQSPVFETGAVPVRRTLRLAESSFESDDELDELMASRFL